jgi:hypothetical protein
MNRKSILRAWIFAIVISLVVEFPFILLLWYGPHSTAGGFGMLFFLPSFGIVSSLVLRDHTPFAAVIVCQTILTSIPLFWIFTSRRRSLSATVLRVSSFLVLLVAASVLLARHARNQEERDDAIKAAAANGVVSSLEAVNRSLTLYKTKYGEYPAQLDALNFPEEGPADSRHAGLMRIPLPMEEFFAFTYNADEITNRKRFGYEIYVDPKPGKWSDLYHYFTDESGLIRFETTHNASKHGLVVLQQLHPSVTTCPPDC